ADFTVSQNRKIAGAQIGKSFDIWFKRSCYGNRPKGSDQFGTLDLSRYYIEITEKFCRITISRLVVQFAGGPILDYFSGSHQHNPISGRKRLLGFVRYDDRRRAEFPQ